MRKLYIPIAIFLILVIAGLTAVYGFFGNRFTPNQPQSQPVSSVASKGKQPPLQKLELAKTTTEQAKGLMFRKELCDTCGMLFIFTIDQQLSFWMENTYVPLDMIFMDKNGKVTNVAANAVPLRQSPTYNSDGLARYVLEVPAGYAAKQGIQTADVLDLQYLLDKGQNFDNSYGPDAGSV